MSDHRSDSSSNNLLAIGLPVYNGKLHIRETIESILGQTMSRLKLVIADNASTDGTDEICREYASRDSRILYLRNHENLGINANTVRAYQESRPSTYFALIGHDDVWKPRFAEKMISLLVGDPGASLAFSYYEYIDENGRVLPRREITAPYARIIKMKDQGRRHRICFQPSAALMSGVVRAESIDPVLIERRYGVYEDVLILRSLAAQGHFLLHPELLFLKRRHRESYSSSPEYRQENRWINCRLASRTLRKHENLTVGETIHLWLSLVGFFHFKKPGLKQWNRMKRIMGKAAA